MLALQCLAISTAITRVLRKACANGRADTGSWSGSNCWIGTEHADSRAKLRSTKRDHVLADVAGDDLPMLRVGVSQNVLNEIVAILVAGDINEWNSRTIKTTFADAIQVTTQKFNATYLQALFDHLRRKLVHAVFRSISNDMISGTTAISWSTMLANMLDAPISKLAVGDNVNAGKYLFDTRTLAKWLVHSV
jgi:hypothetical protein